MEGTPVYSILSSALHDPRHFEKPDALYPGCFLDAQGKFKKPQVFIPSSIRKCLCLDESLAHSQPFLIFTSLLQNFSLGSQKAPEDIDLTPRWFKLYSGFLKFLPGAHRQVYKNLQDVNAFIDHSVEKIRETLDPNVPPYFHPPPPDFIDSYLLCLDTEKSNPNSKCHERNLIITALSLFFPGPETTSTTLRYGLLFTLIYLHIAERIHKEIDQVIGSYRPPALDDRAQMPHTDAVIYEIQRFADLIPICVSHMVTKDALFRGYILPRGTAVYPILSSALHDPGYFEKPDAFNPDHFLEGIACTDLFLFFTITLQNFSVASPMTYEDIDQTPQESGVGRVSPFYKIQFLHHQRKEGYSSP
ncbi:PREDICTED: LOW QUALITY PROTEIN: cytochrome P450 2B11-like [Capra hircus]|uniref:LOW QUALITY PROTEIN: cytochrome P450 2B11-like n=1 Tax=Capra hircus TaxID=9925 RepID=UPI0008472F8C|nr:PREDICTED: LOW QUALITY PROTEIN: cytochrome P450 2B11-like [Capra hircus]